MCEPIRTMELRISMPSAAGCPTLIESSAALETLQGTGNMHSLLKSVTDTEPFQD